MLEAYAAVQYEHRPQSVIHESGNAIRVFGPYRETMRDAVIDGDALSYIRGDGRYAVVGWVHARDYGNSDAALYLLGETADIFPTDTEVMARIKEMLSEIMQRATNGLTEAENEHE